MTLTVCAKLALKLLYLIALALPYLPIYTPFLKKMGLKIYARCEGQVPSCCQDGYRAQVPQPTQIFFFEI